MGLSDQPFEGDMPRLWRRVEGGPGDAVGVIAHTSAPRKKTFGDFGEAARALKDADARRESLFAQSVEAEKNKDDVMAKKFAEAVKKAKSSPLSERPMRDFDLD